MSEPEPAEDALSWCEVDAAALRANLAALRQRLSPGARLGVVVKSEAYGHGLTLCAEEFLAGGADWLVVNSIQEAVSLRQAEIAAPVYVCGHVAGAQAGLVARTRARVVLYDWEVAQALARAGREAGERVRVHLKLETGAYRQGLDLSAALELGRAVRGLQGLELEGLTTHYADIEDTTDHRFAQGQLESLRQAWRAFAGQGMDIPLVHSANSAAAILWPETHGQLVRVGIAAYGLWPSRETYATALERRADQGEQGWVPQLVPALSWRARVVQVKEVPTGAYVGYGRTFRATHPTRIAVLPVGYFEGYDRRLSNLAHVLLKGVRAPVRGRVCMNMAMADITHIPGVGPGSVATLLGQDGEEVVSADLLASWMGTINYEVVSRIHPTVPRFLRHPDPALT